ncbi:MAG: MBL fold metallo-hydrolase [Alphaproteobacteria bacterium]
MRVTVLGCGGAGGVPTIGYGWGNCDPTNPRNRRRRPGILIEHGATKILVDTPPDLREQLLEAAVQRLDAVVYTHDHADHVHGIDDLREINRIMRAPIEVFAGPETLKGITSRFGYAFTPHDLSKYPIYKPWLLAREIGGSFGIDGLEVVPFEQDHGYMTSLGFRIGSMAYSTDVLRLSEEALAVLEGVPLWLVDCFTDREHFTHSHIAQTLDWIRRVRPGRAVLTHMGPRLDYDQLRAQLPPGVEPAYDGMVLELPD